MGEGSSFFRTTNIDKKVARLKDPREQQVLEVCIRYLTHTPVGINDLVLLCNKRGIDVDYENVWKILWCKSNLMLFWRPADDSFRWEGNILEGKSWHWESHGVW